MGENRLMFEDFCTHSEQVHIDDLKLEKGTFTKLHTHNFFEVFIVLEGEFIHQYDDRMQCLTKGMGQFICPRMSHGYKATNNSSGGVLRNIAIHPSVFKQLVSKAKRKMQKDFFEPFEINEYVLYQFGYKTDKLMHEIDERYRRYLMESIWSDLMIYIVEDYHKQKYIPKWLQTSYQQMKEPTNLFQGLPRLLELSCRTQEHVTRAFAKYYDQTPTEYINELRLKESARLLVQSDLLIITIAENCGFNTLTYYNKLFKDYYGISPKVYRQQNKKSIF